MLIAQISDLHILLPNVKAYGVVATDTYLPPALAALNGLRPRPDCVLLTGDLVDGAEAAEYEHLRDMLRALELPCYLMPGNHDARSALRAAFPDHGYLAGADGFIQYAIEDYPLRILALDTVVPREGYGELCATRLDWLEQRLSEQPDRPTAVVMHHPPFRTGIAHMDDLGLRQGAERLDAILRSYDNVVRVMCGHVHRTIFRRFGGTIASICPSTAHQISLDLRPDGPAEFIMEPPGFQLHAWLDGELVTHHGVIGEYEGPYPF